MNCNSNSFNTDNLFPLLALRLHDTYLVILMEEILI